MARPMQPAGAEGPAGQNACQIRQPGHCWPSCAPCSSQHSVCGSPAVPPAPAPPRTRCLCRGAPWAARCSSGGSSRPRGRWAGAPVIAAMTPPTLPDEAGSRHAGMLWPGQTCPQPSIWERSPSYARVPPAHLLLTCRDRYSLPSGPAPPAARTPPLQTQQTAVGGSKQVGGCSECIVYCEMHATMQLLHRKMQVRSSCLAPACACCCTTQGNTRSLARPPTNPPTHPLQQAVLLRLHPLPHLHQVHHRVLAGGDDQHAIQGGAGEEGRHVITVPLRALCRRLVCMRRVRWRISATEFGGGDRAIQHQSGVEKMDKGRGPQWRGWWWAALLPPPAQAWQPRHHSNVWVPRPMHASPSCAPWIEYSSPQGVVCTPSRVAILCCRARLRAGCQ